MFIGPKTEAIHREIEADDQIACAMKIAGQLPSRKEAAIKTLRLAEEIVDWREARRLGLIQAAAE